MNQLFLLKMVLDLLDDTLEGRSPTANQINCARKILKGMIEECSHPVLRGMIEDKDMVKEMLEESELDADAQAAKRELQ